MSDFDFSFDPNAAIDDGLVKPGVYQALIVAADPVKNKAGTGFYLKITYQIRGGEYDAREIVSRLNIKNANPTAEAMAKKSLRQICLASEITSELKDASALVTNKLLSITTKIQKNSDPAFGDNVEITAVNKLGFSNAPGSPAGDRPNWGAPAAGAAPDDDIPF